MPKRKRSNQDHGPEHIGEVISRLFTTRGWGRRQDRLQLEQVWTEVIGEEFAQQTELGSIRRGVLEITVGNAVLLQELAHFHKRRLLEGLRSRLPTITLHDIRFRAGVVNKGNSEKKQP